MDNFTMKQSIIRDGLVPQMVTVLTVLTVFDIEAI